MLICKVYIVYIVNSKNIVCCLQYLSHATGSVVFGTILEGRTN